jgi:hypothetical protein
MESRKPSEKVTTSIFDGKEIKDRLGRVLRLRKPSILDHYYLRRALGEDADNAGCMSMMMNIIYVAGIDGQVLETPHTHSECLASLKRLGEEGIFALAKFADSVMPSPAEEVDKIKK